VGTHVFTGRAGIGFTQLSARPLPHGEFSAPVSLLDLSASIAWKTVEIAAQVQNVLGAEYAATEFNFASHWDPDAPRSRLPARHSSAGAPRTFLLSLEWQL
jgi:outer membrane receptor protein involved in Fe transport